MKNAGVKIFRLEGRSTEHSGMAAQIVTDDAAQVRSRAWALILLFCIAATSLFDFQILPILAQDIKVDFRLSDAGLGLLTGTATGAVQLLVAVPFGYLVDRTNRVRLIAGTVAIWSLCTMGCGLAANFVQLFIARFATGISGAALPPASSSLVADLFSNRRRTSAMSIMLLGSPVGGFLGLVVGGYLASKWGWRTAFVVAGVPGLILSPLTLLTMREPARMQITGGNAVAKVLPLGATVKMLAASNVFKGMIAASACAQSLVYVAGSWLPPLLIRARHMSTFEAGGFVAIALGIGGATGLIGGGVACDFLRARIRHAELKFMIAVLAVSAPALLGAVFSPGKLSSMASMFLFSMCSSSALPVTIIIIQAAVGAYARGFAIALNTSIGMCLGMGLGVPLVGLASDFLQPRWGEGALAYVLASTSILAVIAIIFLLAVLVRSSQTERARTAC